VQGIGFWGLGVGSSVVCVRQCVCVLCVRAAQCMGTDTFKDTFKDTYKDLRAVQCMGTDTFDVLYAFCALYAF